LDVDVATEKILDWLEKEGVGTKKKQYHLRDWVFSRQHYWGEPIPLVFCPECEKQAAIFKSQFPNSNDGSVGFNKGELLNPGWTALLENQLPLELPKVKKYEPTGTGESPLSAIKSWVNTTCPKCGGAARRETDTMPNWAGSSWYYLAYLIKQISKSQFPMTNYGEAFKYWLPVDLYNGGMEHTTLHLLYSRFWHKFLYDIGVVPTIEPYQQRVSHGMILAPDGQKMSKSRGNVINPDDIVSEYGADVLRMYEMFMGPYDQAVAWDLNGVKGIKRFLDKVWALSEKADATLDAENGVALMHKTVKTVGNDIDSMKFNTAVAALMIFVNEMGARDAVPIVAYKNLLLLLYPFAPHIASELWENLKFDGKIHEQTWPKYDEAKLVAKTLEIPVQINGKVRFTVQVDVSAPEGVLWGAIEKEPIFLKHSEGKKVVKRMYIAGKIASVVLK
jgi:leucyl-tRNA synthetase